MTPRWRVAAVVLTAALAAVAYVPDPNGTGVHPGDGDFDVWAMNAGGSDQRQLTHTANGEDRSPGCRTAASSPRASMATGQCPTGT
jgi:hypothetical protein